MGKGRNHHSKQYEMIHDPSKVAPPRVDSYDDISPGHGVVYSPSIKRPEPIDFHGQWPPKGPIMMKLNEVYGNPWNAQHTWQKDGYIEETILQDSSRVSDGTVIFCMTVSVAVVFGIIYMFCRLLLNSWCRYRRGRAVRSDSWIYSWGKSAGKWFDAVCLKIGERQAMYHLDRFSNRRMQTYPV